MIVMLLIVMSVIVMLVTVMLLTPIHARKVHSGNRPLLGVNQASRVESRGMVSDS